MAVAMIYPQPEKGGDRESAAAKSSLKTKPDLPVNPGSQRPGGAGRGMPRGPLCVPRTSSGMLKVKSGNIGDEGRQERVVS